MNNLFFLSSLTLSITAISLFLTILKNGKEQIHKLFAFFNLAIFVWGCGATIVTISSHDKSISEFSYRIACVGATFIPILLFHTISCLFKLKKYKSFLFIYYFQGILFTILLLASNLILTKPLNKLYGSFYIPSPGILFLYAWFAAWTIIVIHSHFLLLQYLILHKERFLKLTALAFLFGFFTGTLNFSIPFNVKISQIANFGIALYCLFLFYAIFKHKLFGLEIVLKKSLLYSILISILTGIYLLLIIMIESIFRDVLGYKSLIISLSAAFIISLLFTPLRYRIQFLLDTLFIGKTPFEIAYENKLLIKELERSERLKTASTLALGLCHEIKNPLTTIRTFAEYLPEKYKDDEFVKKFSRIIPSEVERINSIVKQLLDFSKPTPPSYCDTNIHQLLNEILAFLNSEFLKKHINIERFDKDQSLSAKIDPSQIKQALLNIILNALDAMPRGGILAIKSEASYDNNLRISISDTGYGIPKEDLKRIFDPFFSNKDAGTGLGLSIAYNIIQNHKGFIEVESEIRKGTTFIVKLPLERLEG